MVVERPARGQRVRRHGMPGCAKEEPTVGERILSIEDKRDWVARARELAPMVEAAAGRTEAERKIPADVLTAMHDAGLFHILLPVPLGGAAADLVTFNQVIETIAAADANPAWCWPRRWRARTPLDFS